MKDRRARSRWLLVYLFLVGLGDHRSIAQDYRARVQGLVTDSTQVAMVGVRVTLRNVNTGAEAAKESSIRGEYLFDFVEPGIYVVTASMPGFTKLVQENILVQTRADVTVNFSLKPGTVFETVIVSEAPVALQLNTSSRALTVDQKQLMELPVKARNPFTLALLDPAVVNRYTGFDRNPFFMWSSSSIDVGGNTSRKNDLLLDGAPIQVGEKGSYAPPMDAVQEFTVQQNSVDAEFGHSAGGILNLAMKSGTNAWHGSAYYFGRNPRLNAVSNPIVRSPNQIRNHIAGGTVGGPVRKNKLFTFTSYEVWRTKEPLTTIRTVPTALERRGDFSRSFNINGGLRTIYDPYTTRFDPGTGTATREPFAGNIIPLERQDATARRMMQDIWEPNNPGDDVTGVNNYKQSYFWFLNNWNFSNRSDWNANDKWRIFGRYSRFRTDLDQLNYTPNNSRAMPNDNGGIMNSRSIAADAVYTLNAQTVLDFRGSFASLEDDYFAPASIMGESGLAELWPNNPWYKPYLKDVLAIYYPYVFIAGAGSYGKGGYWVQHPRNYCFSGKASKDHGRHYLKWGGETRFHRSDGIYPDLMQFNFGPSLTADTFLSPDTRLSGDAHATLLLGVLGDPQVGESRAQLISYQEVSVDYYAAFFHDDFKLNRNVTVNAGLRYEYEGPPKDAENRYSRYVDLSDPIPEMKANPPAIPDDINSLRGRPPILNGAWVFADNQHRGQFDTQKLVFMPRLGAAIRMGDQTVVQVGYGRYVIPPLLVSNTLGTLTFDGFNATTTVLPSVEGVPSAVLSNPFPADRNPLIPAVGRGRGRYTNLGGPASWQQQKLRTGVNDRFSFSLQRELPGSFRADVTYFVNLGHDLPYAKQLNMVDPQLRYTYKGLLSQQVENPFYNYLTPDTFPGTLRNQPRVSRETLLRPYPQYGDLTQLNTAGFLNRYQALQMRIQRTYASGASLLWAYNYNREKTSNFFNDIDQYAGHLTFLKSNNPRHRMTISGTADLPFGKGQAWLNNANPIVNAILGGWSTSSIFYFNSGDFLRFGAVLAEGNPRISNPSTEKWFDTSKFKVLLPFTPRTNPYQYEGLTGPSYWNLDTSLSKMFRIEERVRLELRMEAYNLTNSFFWANPNTSVTSSLFGRSTSQRQGNRGRELQYSLRLTF